MSREAMELLPCPFCGGAWITVVDGSTFRWRQAYCEQCEAKGPEVRIQTLGDGSKEQWEEQARKDAIAEWNRRAALAAPQEPTWVCNKCGVDRFKAPCPRNSIGIDCPMIGTALAAAQEGKP